MKTALLVSVLMSTEFEQLKVNENTNVLPGYITLSFAILRPISMEVSSYWKEFAPCSLVH